MPQNKRGNVDKISGTDVDITRRTFLQKSLLTGGAITTGTAVGLFQTLSSMEVAAAAGNSFSFAWVSDTHLYPQTLNQRFVDQAVRAFRGIQAVDGKFDFMIFGGDLAQRGDPVGFELGVDLLKEVTVRKHFIPGEHDWYLDMGETWNDHFGESPWTFKHKGVLIIGLDTVGNAPDYWTARGMTPKERMGHIEATDGSMSGPWSGLGKNNRDWLSTTLSDWPKDAPVIIFSHTPLWERYAPWNFWIRDWREVHEIIRPWQNITNVHGHVHQPLYKQIGGMRSIGMLATCWPWPYAPQGIAKSTEPDERVDPDDGADDIGWSTLTSVDGNVENEYVMWREQKFAKTGTESGTASNPNHAMFPG